MKLASIISLLLPLAFIGCSPGNGGTAKHNPNVSMLQPATLAATINDSNAVLPAIFNLGPFPELKGAIDIGPGEDAENIEKLKMAVKDMPKDTTIVIYCGCCPFDKCPNVFPAMRMLTDMGFTNHQLLNLDTNFKTDWMNKGYPVKQ